MALKMNMFILDMEYYVYIMSNKRRTTLYIGVTSKIEERILQHRRGDLPGFSKKYQLKDLVYYEVFDDVSQAINREKSLKGKRRSKKDALISAMNPTWSDLSGRLV